MKSSLSFYEKTLMESENLRRKGKWWAWGIGVNNQANGMSGSCLNKSLKAQVLLRKPRGRGEEGGRGRKGFCDP
jgi:hypothetical protein